MLDRATCRTRVNCCTSLGELCDTLNNIMDEIRSESARADGRERRSHDECRAREAARFQDLVDLSQLLVYTSARPPSDPWVYSWDATHYLTCISDTDNDRWVVRPHYGQISVI